MAHPLRLKEKAKALRLKGYSVKRIAKELHISLSTSSLWIRGILLPAHIRKYLEKQAGEGRAKGWQVLRAMRDHQHSLDRKEASASVQRIRFTKDIWKFLVAIIFWCEGSKRSLSGGVRLTNSDPYLVSLFLTGLEKGFEIQRKQLKARLHLHQYHDERKQKFFWSGITGIPVSHFYPSYWKPNTGKRIREAYPGCISVTYGRAQLARKIDAYYRAVFQSIIGV